MSDDARYQQLLRRKAGQLERAHRGRPEAAPPGMALAGAEPSAAALEAGRSETRRLEAIVRWYRPVLVVKDDEVVLPPEGAAASADPSGQVSTELLAALRPNLEALHGAIPAVGRIELTNNLHYPWVGTGWVVDTELGDDIVVTNAHVAREFAHRGRAGFSFRAGVPDASLTQSAWVDFREELGPAAPRELPITEIIWISDNPRLDIAILRAARRAGANRLSSPIRLLEGGLSAGQLLAVVGYPGSNNGYDPEPFRQLFGAVTGKKRLSPGRHTGGQGDSVTYDCSTLPGSSGSVVLDVASGRAAALHFAGTAFEANYGVPAADLRKVLRDRPWQPEAHPAARAAGGAAAPGARDARTEIVVPLRISLSFDAPILDQGLGLAGASPPHRASTSSVERVAEEVRARLSGNADVLRVRAEHLFRDGELTDDRGVVVLVTPGASLDLRAYDVPVDVQGVAVVVETADPATVVETGLGVSLESFGGRFAGYERREAAAFDLSPIEARIKLQLHVSPEAGWAVLERFLADRRHQKLTVGMYHMTAPHVVQAIEAVARAKELTLTLDRQRGDAVAPDDTGGETKANDIPERATLARLQAAAPRFQWAPASLGANGLFPSAYHVKAAVWSRGSGAAAKGKRFWLSSGNWQSSNQPTLGVAVTELPSLSWEDVRDYNREWHCVVDHEGLATTLLAHLEQDYLDNQAAAGFEAPRPRVTDVLVPLTALERPRPPRRFEVFPPTPIDDRMTVQLLLTPDNYPEIVADLVSQARRRLWIENQSFTLWKEGTPDHFLAIAEAVRGRQRAGVDVRIIFRSGYGKERETLRRLKDFGLEVDSEHVRYFDTCHTKGIVIDDDVAVLGSQNWTAAGTGPNRDASLLVRHPEANAFFARLFEYDWSQLAVNRVRSDEAVAGPIRFVNAGDESPPPRGYRRITLAEYLGES